MIGSILTLLIPSTRIYKVRDGSHIGDAIEEARELAREQRAEIGFFHRDVLVFVVADSDVDEVEDAWKDQRLTDNPGDFCGVVRLHQPSQT